MVNQGELCPSVGRAESGRIVNAHGRNEKVEEAAKASVRPCFIVVYDKMYAMPVVMNSNCLV